jgi:hypothetical protein
VKNNEIYDIILLLLESRKKGETTLTIRRKDSTTYNLTYNNKPIKECADVRMENT